MTAEEKIFLVQLEKHKGILYKVARIYMDAGPDREDLQQEIIIQLWKSFGNFKGQSEFSTWMYRVAVNTAITFFKKEKKRIDNHPIHSQDTPAAEAYNPYKDRQLDCFYKAVQQLKPIEKALIFYFMEGFSHKEIGSCLGISEGNARVKLNRTKEKLQEIIKNSGYEI